MKNCYDFKVDREQLYATSDVTKENSSKGLDAGHDAIIRCDENGKHQSVISVVGRGYKLVLHKDVVDGFTAIIKKQFDMISDPEFKVHVTNNGGRIYATYKIPIQIDIDSNEETNSISCRLIIQNSYDETKTVSILVSGQIQSKVSNSFNFVTTGKQASQTVSTISNFDRKHTENLNITLLAKKIDNAIEMFKECKIVFETAARKYLNPNDIHELVLGKKGILIQNGFPSTYIDRIKVANRSDINNSNTYWKLYCVISYWLNHVYPVEYAGRYSYERWIDLSRIAYSLLLQ